MNTKLVLAGIAAVALALITAAPAVASPPSTSTATSLTGVSIVLTNDDSMQNARPNGADGLGLYEVRRALCAAGADVVVIAPWGYQSGAGSAVTSSGQLTAAQRTALPAGFEGDCADAPSGGVVFGLCKGAGPCTSGTPSATPADTAKFAARGGATALVGWSEAPDLVVSGINSGPNVSASINDSGTVGAAIAAIDSSVPAIALSADVGEEFVPTAETYRAAADFSARFIANLVNKKLLTDEYVINLNYPDITGGYSPAGVKWTSMGDGAVIVHLYEQHSATTFTIGGALCPDSEFCRPETRADADSTALFAGNVSISALQSDRTLAGNEANKLRSLVKSGKLTN